MAGEPGGQRLEGADAREARHLVTPVPALPQAVRPALSRSRTELTGLRRPSGSGRGRRCPTPASAPARGAWLAGCPPGLACTHNLGPGPGVQIGSSQMSLVRLKGRVASGWALSSGGLVSLRNRTHRRSERADGVGRGRQHFEVEGRVSQLWGRGDQQNLEEAGRVPRAVRGARPRRHLGFGVLLTNSPAKAVTRSRLYLQGFRHTL